MCVCSNENLVDHYTIDMYTVQCVKEEGWDGGEGLRGVRYLTMHMTR